MSDKQKPAVSKHRDEVQASFSKAMDKVIAHNQKEWSRFAEQRMRACSTPSRAA